MANLMRRRDFETKENRYVCYPSDPILYNAINTHTQIF